MLVMSDQQSPGVGRDVKGEVGRSAVRVRAAPALDPPFEDQGAATTSSGMEWLPLDWPARAAEAPQQQTTEAAPVPMASPSRQPCAPRPPVPMVTTPGAAAAHRFVSLCVEVLNGFRPAAHLRPLIPPHRFTSVADQLLRRTVRVRVRRATRQLSRMIRVRRLVLCEPCEGVAEVAVVLDDGRSCWAMVIRMEHQPRGWMCTLVQVV